jgi:hypothetical protein
MSRTVLNYALLPTIAVMLAGAGTISAAFGQGFYSSPSPSGSTSGSSGQVTDQQLQQCQQLGIDRTQCNDGTILAKERLTTAEKTQYGNQAYGSGTPLLSTGTGQMAIFIGVLAAIFGGVAAVFFFKGRGAKPIST